MSYSKMVTIICDKCGDTADSSGWTVAEARKLARGLGYTYDAPDDVCALCRKDEEFGPWPPEIPPEEFMPVDLNDEMDMRL